MTLVVAVRFVLNWTMWFFTLIKLLSIHELICVLFLSFYSVFMDMEHFCSCWWDLESTLPFRAWTRVFPFRSFSGHFFYLINDFPMWSFWTLVSIEFLPQQPRSVVHLFPRVLLTFHNYHHRWLGGRGCGGRHWRLCRFSVRWWGTRRSQ